MHKNILYISILALFPGALFAHDKPDTAPHKGEYFSAYKPNYIGASSNGGENSTCDLKFQFSIKQRLAPPLGEADSIEEINKLWYKRFYFGYTQKSFWDICRDSAPFRDSVYAPEIFHMKEIRIDSGTKGIKLKRLQAGIRHGSNGKDGPDSRSWNRLYGEVEYAYGYKLWNSPFGVESNYGFQEGDVQKLSVGVEGWYIIDTGNENNDIEDYLGYTKLNVRISTRSEQLALSGWVGKKGKVSIETNLVIKSLPLLNSIIPLVGDILPNSDNTYFWHVQYFNGYGDELIRYNTRDRVIRLGLLFTY